MFINDPDGVGHAVTEAWRLIAERCNAYRGGQWSINNVPYFLPPQTCGSGDVAIRAIKMGAIQEVVRICRVRAILDTTTYRPDPLICSIVRNV